MLEESTPVSRPERDWRHPDLRAWLAKESLAAGLGVAPLRRLHVPVYANVFAVGLDGAGALGVEVTPQQIAEWMQHLEHVVPQHVVSRDASVAENAPAPEDGAAAAQELEHTASSRSRGRSGRNKLREGDDDDDAPVDQSATPASEADAARISYRYHIRLVQLSPKVVSVLERYLGIHYRVANDKHTEFQVDAEIINGLLEGLVRHLKLDESEHKQAVQTKSDCNPFAAHRVLAPGPTDCDSFSVHVSRLCSAYNVFVLNPSQDWLVVPASVPLEQRVTYGYRSGFSNDELDALLEPADAAVKKFVDEWRTNAAASYTNQLERDRAAGPQPVPQFTPRPAEGGGGGDGEKRAPHLQVLDHLAASDAWATSVLNAPHFTGPQPLLSYLRQQSEHHSEVLRASIGNNQAHEDCLVDAWVGRGRTLFLDLGAGPARWGPIVGGEGVKSASSFPSLKTFASARAAELAEDQAEDPYVDASYDADAVAAERIVLLDMLDAQCGGRGADGDGEEGATGGRESSAECLSIESKLADLAEFEESHTHRIVGESSATPAPATKPPPMDSEEGLSFFHDDKPNHGAPGTTSGHDASIEVDHFMAHLSSTLSASLHQVLTPSVGDTHRSGGYAQRVHFHLYALVNHQHYDPLGDQFVARLKYGLEQLRMPSQTFVYSVHKLTLADDPALAMAYTAALRSSVVPSLMFDGRFSAIKRLYLDSRLLRASLASMDVQGKAEHDPLYGQANRAAAAAAAAAAASGSSFKTTRGTRDISIFLFSLDFPLPVLVDKYYQSQALPESDMVVAVQSNLRLWESPLSCNGKPTYWNLRDPLRSVLSSVAHVLGGLLPMHVKHSSAHGRVAQDWLWSVGLSPLALTSAQGLEFSQTQRDTLHRNYVLTAMRAATQVVNRQMRMLARQKTSLSNRMLAGIDDLPLTESEAGALNATLAPGAAVPSGRYSLRTHELQSAYSAFAALLTGEMMAAIEALDFDRACRNIDALYRSANQSALKHAAHAARLTCA